MLDGLRGLCPSWTGNFGADRDTSEASESEPSCVELPGYGLYWAGSAVKLHISYRRRDICICSAVAILRQPLKATPHFSSRSGSEYNLPSISIYRAFL